MAALKLKLSNAFQSIFKFKFVGSIYRAIFRILWQIWRNLPWPARLFHSAGNHDVPRPDVELPFPESQETTEDISAVHTNPHINVDVCFFSKISKLKRDFVEEIKKNN